MSKTDAIFTTPRLWLRRFRPTDVEAYYSYMCLEQTARYENFDPLTREEAQEEVVERCAMENRLAVQVQTGQDLLGENVSMIGDVGYEELPFDTYIFSYDFHVDYGKNGYAAEAVDALVDYLFRAKNARRLYAECSDKNQGSIRLLERLGFRREGCHWEDISYKEDENGAPIFQNTLFYAMLRREYAAKTARTPMK